MFKRPTKRGWVILGGGAAFLVALAFPSPVTAVIGGIGWILAMTLDNE